MNFTKLIVALAIAATLMLSSCGPQPTPTPTPEPTATTAPTDTPEPTPTETATPEPSATPDLTAQPAQGSPAGAQPANPAPVVEDQYLYVSQTLPDGYQVRPRTTIGITWTVKNPGPTAWTTDYSLNQYAGPDIGKPYMALTKAVAANETTTITLTFVTPDVPGEYNLWYKVTNALGQHFGDVNFTFTVTNSPNYNAPATATPGT